MKTKLLQVVSFCLLLGSCGGGGSSSPGTMDFIDRSGITVGSISGFSSVIVNGVTFDISSATITVDDQPAQESNLSVGQLVVIDGTVESDGTGVANSVSSDPSIQGQIQAIDSIQSVFTILSTRVVVNGATLFGPNIVPGAVATLQLDERVEVYGYRRANSDIVATLIIRTTDEELELNGRVRNLDSDAMRFDIGGQIVDFTTATLVDFTDSISENDLVEVEGTMLDSSGVLQADRVELEASTEFDADDSGTEVELDGIVTRFVSAQDFEVNGVACTTTDQTQVEDGLLSDLQLDSRIEVEGVVNENGVLVADEIEFEAQSNLEMQAVVEAVDASDQSVTLLGITFRATQQTQLIDEADTQLKQFSLADVAIGDWIKVKAFTDSTGATLNLFKRKNPEDKMKLSGVIGSVVDPSLFVDSAEISTNASTQFEVNEVQTSAVDFFSTVTAGQRLDAEGQSVVPGVLTAETVSVED